MSDSPILIVGAGPVGLALARALTLHHIPVHVFEALPTLSTEARASTFHPSTLEMLAEWGVIEAMLKQGHRVDSLEYWERASRQRVAKFNYSLIAGDTPYPFRLQLPQFRLTHLLQPLIEDSESGAVHFQHQFVEFSDNGHRVSATFETPTGRKTYAGAYLIGTDGSRSSVRRQLGLSFEGLTYPDRFLLLPCEVNLQTVFPGLGPVNYVFDPEEWVIILYLPEVVRVVFQIRPEEDEAEVLSPAAIHQRLVGLVGANTPFMLKGPSIYSVHQRVAETFRVGQVLLAGDAAHINNPAGGMGMNSGIHDAHLLADALTRVWVGESEVVLDDYARTRRAWAIDRVQQHTHDTYAALTAKDATARQTRNDYFRSMATDPVKAREYLLRASMLDDRLA